MHQICATTFELNDKVRCVRRFGHRGHHEGHLLIDHDGSSGLIVVVQWAYVDVEIEPHECPAVAAVPS